MSPAGLSARAGSVKSPAVRDVLTALTALRQQVRWRSSEPDHLRQRVRALIELGHLPLGATIDTLAAVVAAIAADPDAQVYLCRSGEADYPVLLSRVTGYPWIVLLDMSGAVETATPSSNPRSYLSDDRFTRLGPAHGLAG